MHALIVVSNPRQTSFSHALVEQAKAGLVANGHTFEVADIAAENFDSRMGEHDLDYTFSRGPVPEDVKREQERIDRADAIIMIYPLYWWSMPGTLKGWVDRVFQANWAYGWNEEGAIIPLLKDRPVHVLAHGDTDDAGLDKRGYRSAINVVIDGIFGFCGIKDQNIKLLTEVSAEDGTNRDEYLEIAYNIGKTIFDAKAGAEAVSETV